MAVWCSRESLLSLDSEPHCGPGLSNGLRLCACVGVVAFQNDGHVQLQHCRAPCLQRQPRYVPPLRSGMPSPLPCGLPPPPFLRHPRPAPWQPRALCNVLQGDACCAAVAARFFLAALPPFARLPRPQSSFSARRRLRPCLPLLTVLRARPVVLGFVVRKGG